MKALKKNLPAVISIVMLAVISAFWIVAAVVSSADLVRPIVLICVGAVIITLMAFVKEQHIHKSSLYVYFVVIALLVVTLFFDYPIYGFHRYLVFGYITIYPAALLPFTGIQAASMISRYKNVSIPRFMGICAVALLPALLVYFQNNTMPVLMLLAVALITAFIMSVKKRVNIHPALFIIPIVLAIVLFFIVYNGDTYFSSYIRERIEVILTRGQCDPLDSGWVRTTIDSIFTSTPFIGRTEYAFMSDMTEYIYNWGDFKLVALIAEYGWLAFVIAISVFAVFFACLFTMVKKTNQSAFAKYTSIIMALYLLLQAVINLAGIFLLDTNYMEMPFMTSSITQSFSNYLAFAIILTLYLKRDKTSVDPEPKCDESKNNQIVQFFKDIFKDEADDEYDDDFLSSGSSGANNVCSMLIKICLERAKENPEEYTEDLAKSYLYAAELYDETGSMPTTAMYYKDAVEVYEKLYNENPEKYKAKLSGCLYKTSRHMVNVRKYKDGEEYILRAIALCKGDPEQMDVYDLLVLTDYYNLAGECYEKQENYGLAESYYITEAEIYKSLTLGAFDLAEKYSDLGNFYAKRNKYSKAIEYYILSAQTYEELADEKLFKKTYRTAAKYAFESDHWIDAYRYFTYAKNGFKTEATEEEKEE